MRHCSVYLIWFVKLAVLPARDFSKMLIAEGEKNTRVNRRVSSTLWQAQQGLQIAELWVKVLGLQPWLPYLPTSQVPSLSLSVLICKMGRVVIQVHYRGCEVSMAADGETSPQCLSSPEIKGDMRVFKKSGLSHCMFPLSSEVTLGRILQWFLTSARFH